MLPVRMALLLILALLCGPASAVIDMDDESPSVIVKALRNLANELQPAGWSAGTGWPAAPNAKATGFSRTGSLIAIWQGANVSALPCSGEGLPWLGVSCSDGEVVGLQLRSLGLDGRLPLPDFITAPLAILFSSLTTLDLGGNELRGDVPHAWGPWLPNLDRLNLEHNRLTGPLPSSLAQASQLEVMVLAGNRGLTGSMPVEWVNLGRLRVLDLGGCSITGTLPVAWSRLTRLMDLDLSGNDITGSLPTEWSALHALLKLNLADNHLGGLLPEVWGQGMSRLRALNLSENALVGPLPSSFSAFSVLQNLHLGGNQLAGMMPASWVRLRGLAALDLSNNTGLCGPWPSTLSKGGLVYVEGTGLALTPGDNSPCSWATEAAALLEIKHDLVPLNASRIAPLASWRHGLPPCGASPWEGVSCQDGQVIGLNLTGVGLQGLFSVPTSLTTLTALSSIDLKDCGLTGPLPDAWSSLTHLTYLHVAKNRFSLTLPTSWSKLINLVSLDLSDNFILGTLPVAWSTLSNLQQLSLDGNPGLGPSFPLAWSTSMLSLRTLVVDPVMLAGILPTQWQPLAGLGSTATAVRRLRSSGSSNVNVDACAISAVRTGRAITISMPPSGEGQECRQGIPSFIADMAKHEPHNKPKLRDILLGTLIGGIGSIGIAGAALFAWRSAVTTRPTKIPFNGKIDAKTRLLQSFTISSNSFSQRMHDMSFNRPGHMVAPGHAAGVAARRLGRVRSNPGNLNLEIPYPTDVPDAPDSPYESFSVASRMGSMLGAKQQGSWDAPWSPAWWSRRGGQTPPAPAIEMSGAALRVPNTATRPAQADTDSTLAAQTLLASGLHALAVPTSWGGSIMGTPLGVTPEHSPPGSPMEDASRMAVWRSPAQIRARSRGEFSGGGAAPTHNVDGSGQARDSPFYDLSKDKDGAATSIYMGNTAPVPLHGTSTASRMAQGGHLAVPGRATHTDVEDAREEGEDIPERSWVSQLWASQIASRNLSQQVSSTGVDSQFASQMSSGTWQLPAAASAGGDGRQTSGGGIDTSPRSPRSPRQGQVSEATSRRGTVSPRQGQVRQPSAAEVASHLMSLSGALPRQPSFTSGGGGTHLLSRLSASSNVSPRHASAGGSMGSAGSPGVEMSSVCGGMSTGEAMGILNNASRTRASASARETAHQMQFDDLGSPRMQCELPRVSSALDSLQLIDKGDEDMSSPDLSALAGQGPQGRRTGSASQVDSSYADLSPAHLSPGGLARQQVVPRRLKRLSLGVEGSQGEYGPAPSSGDHVMEDVVIPMATRSRQSDMLHQLFGSTAELVAVLASDDPPMNSIEGREVPGPRGGQHMTAARLGRPPYETSNPDAARGRELSLSGMWSLGTNAQPAQSAQRIGGAGDAVHTPTSQLGAQSAAAPDLKPRGI